MEENNNITPSTNESSNVNNVEDKLKDLAKDGARMAGKAAAGAAKATGKAAAGAAKTGLRSLMTPILIVAAVVIVGGGLFAGFKLDWFHKDLTIDKTANVVEEVKKIGQFTTSCYYEEVPLRDFRIDTVERSGIFGIGAGKSFKENEIVIVGKGRVRAGFDLSKLQADDINVHGDTLEMVLPQVEMFDIMMNPSDFTTEYESGTWSHELTKPLKERAKVQLENNALEFGILQKAEESGLKRLETLFRTFGFNTVLLTVSKPSAGPSATEAVVTETANSLPTSTDSTLLSE